MTVTDSKWERPSGVRIKGPRTPNNGWVSGWVNAVANYSDDLHTRAHTNEPATETSLAGGYASHCHAIRQRKRSGGKQQHKHLLQERWNCRTGHCRTRKWRIGQWRTDIARYEMSNVDLSNRSLLTPCNIGTHQTSYVSDSNIINLLTV